MKQLDLRTLGLDELRPDEMRNVEGGWGFLIILIFFVAPVVTAEVYDWFW